MQNTSKYKNGMHRCILEKSTNSQKQRTRKGCEFSSVLNIGRVLVGVLWRGILKRAAVEHAASINEVFEMKSPVLLCMCCFHTESSWFSSLILFSSVSGLFVRNKHSLCLKESQESLRSLRHRSLLLSQKMFFSCSLLYCNLSCSENQSFSSQLESNNLYKCSAFPPTRPWCLNRPWTTAHLREEEGRREKGGERETVKKWGGVNTKN